MELEWIKTNYASVYQPEGRRLGRSNYILHKKWCGAPRPVWAGDVRRQGAIPQAPGGAARRYSVKQYKYKVLTCVGAGALFIVQERRIYYTANCCGQIQMERLVHFLSLEIRK
ncbi:hypothetical protein J6590_005260 [Homalodisca vitripennis]|nr:hypothetical protein J6590_005260 [Homalodisca vitripennis]